MLQILLTIQHTSFILKVATSLFAWNQPLISQRQLLESSFNPQISFMCSRALRNHIIQCVIRYANSSFTPKEVCEIHTCCLSQEQNSFYSRVAQYYLDTTCQWTLVLFLVFGESYCVHQVLLKMGMHDLNKQSYMFISLCFVLYSKGHNFPSSVLHLDAC